MNKVVGKTSPGMQVALHLRAPWVREVGRLTQPEERLGWARNPQHAL